MNSPFPGMDPYLEGSLWTSVHTVLSTEIARLLAPKLRPRYVALLTRRSVVDIEEDSPRKSADIYPDVAVFESRPGAGETRGAAVVAAPLRIATFMPEPVPMFTVEIRDVAERRLVTTLEVLSPTNKRGEGHLEYLSKRRRVLFSTAHLMEIDLLREGHRVPMQRPLPPAPYFIFLSRVENRPMTDVWPIGLKDPLPTVPIPLLPQDDDVLLDLQMALECTYDQFGFDGLCDYTKPPEIPLPPEDAAWADERLRAAGLRR